MDIQDIHQLFLQCSSLSIDTRKIEHNCFFVAIKGERFDANTFAAEALEKGALYVLIDNKDYYINDRTILVDDTLSALQELAKFHRRFLGIPIVALTGSNGKTTTKELINVVLSKRFNTKATAGNLNNHIGVPLTILSFDENTEMGIVEMGANHQKEIAFLCTIATPDYGYITNFGKAHLDGFGGFEGVIKGKSEMYDYLLSNKKTAFVNLDDALQVQRSKNIAAITFGMNRPDAFLNIDKTIANPLVKINYNATEIQSHLIGLYNANNLYAAIAIGKYFGVSDSEIREAIENYIPQNNRSQIIIKETNEIILDAYNANPSSMKVAIENFIQLEKPSKIMFLGDMFELGSESLNEHKNIVSLLEGNTKAACYFIGHDFYASRSEQSNFHFFETFEALAANKKFRKIHDSLILIKGSRGMALERILELLPS
ncbi:UDP-N-acetylmuramoyl-tripeptide--D-alanyl-D-alanine ligase [Flavobacterium pallidum]|uniref:UDP-N-acetylmuramoyl-tripeptide--D-alanyl-D-alanine ligase n=1 Tax=Flavobacterium pallidum TaxID=2172098 RepID=A0A2S1SGR9_9FLAO|nr:UDP-N-acetylmuramoyl-tripeptide--D-alanyl-D-alanine ligase [Flavobacterium pallidum]AWI25575.1 UDP-N-acetylmuramoyl-tripeptide--D-alanyl-D-alanine ligase [Flavobacterium pallidum]